MAAAVPLPAKGALRRRPKARANAGRRTATHAQLTETGNKLDPDRVSYLGEKLGEGSYGVVYEGELRAPRQRVVLKRVRPRVEWAEEFAEMERKLNAYVAKAAPGSCAPFLGSIEVPKDFVSNRPGTRALQAGTWLVWEHEGTETVDHFLRRPRNSGLRELAKALGCTDELAGVRVALRQLCTSVQRLHLSGLVHRDVKPSNVVVASGPKQLRLVDLGAACDLRQGTNFVPSEAVLDPLYSPPEKFVVPPNEELDFSAAPGGKLGASTLLSPIVWARFEPGLFDSWTLGVTLMQMCIPKLRSSRGLKQFNVELKASGYELSEWRETYGAKYSAEDTWVLDAENGLGWDLACRLVTPRRRPTSSPKEDDVYAEYEVLGETAMYSDTGRQRMSVDEALRHPFLAAASTSSAPATLAAAGVGGFDGDDGEEASGRGGLGGLGGLFGIFTGGGWERPPTSRESADEVRAAGGSWGSGGDDLAKRNGTSGSKNTSTEASMPEEGARVKGDDLKAAAAKCNASNPPRRGERIAVLRTNGQWQHAVVIAGAPWGFIRVRVGRPEESSMLVKDIAAEDLASAVRRWPGGAPPVAEARLPSVRRVSLSESGSSSGGAKPSATARDGGGRASSSSLWELAVDLLNLERRVGTARGTARALAAKAQNAKEVKVAQPEAAEAELSGIQEQLANLADGLKQSVSSKADDGVVDIKATSVPSAAEEGAPEPVDDNERGARDSVVSAVRAVGAFGGLAARVVSDVIGEAFGADTAKAKDDPKKAIKENVVPKKQAAVQDEKSVAMATFVEDDDPAEKEEEEEGEEPAPPAVLAELDLELDSDSDGEEYEAMREKLRLLEEQVLLLESQMESMAQSGGGSVPKAEPTSFAPKPSPRVERNGAKP